MTVSLMTQMPGVGITPKVAQPFEFPGGELHLKMLENPAADAQVTWIADVRGCDPKDLVVAALLADVARERDDPFVLLSPYLPAARADRGTPLGVRVYGELINSMGATQVIGIDPHSFVAAQEIQQLTALDPLPLVQRALQIVGPKYDAVIAPDKGAADRAYLVADELGMDFYGAEKVRDFDTGEITGITVPEMPKTGKYLVVDDICDGGATFRILASHLGLPKDRLGLWITHGIFSGAADTLRQLFGDIFTTDSHPGCGRVEVAATRVPCYTYMLDHVKEL